MTENSEPRDTVDHSVDIGAELEAVNLVIAAIQRLSDEGRANVLRTVATFLAVPIGGAFLQQAGRVGSRPAFDDSATSSASGSSGFSEDRALSPKEFLLQKRPLTDVDRVAALGYYLTHYRDQPTFKTLDLSKLNTEAAQIKLSNAAQAVDNASKAGLFINAARGEKRLSAGGELYIQELPNRETARAAMAQFRLKRKGRKNKAGIARPDVEDASSDDDQESE
jgi:hypothetical protein